MNSRQTVWFGGLAALSIIIQMASTNAWSATAHARDHKGGAESEAPPENGVTPSPFGVTYFGEFSGPSLGNSSAYQPGPYSAHDPSADKLNLYNSISGGYKLSDEVKVGVNPRFEFRPSGTPLTQTMAISGGPDLKLLNPRIFIEKANIVNTGDFTLKGRFDLEFPADSDYTTKNMLVAPAITVIAVYNIPNSRFSIIVPAYFRVYLYGADSHNAAGVLNPGRDMRAYAVPTVNYKLTGNLSLTTDYEMDNDHLRASTSETNWKSLGTDLQTGVTWDISEKVSFFPFIQIFPAGKIDLDTSSIGFYLSAAYP